MSRSSTSSSDDDATRVWTFAKRLSLFLLPLAAMVGSLEYAMYRSGESWTYSRLLPLQAAQPDLVWSRSCFEQQFNVYKPLTLVDRKPQIVTLGSSRVMKFRDFMFQPHEEGFYNCGNLIQEVSDVTRYVDMMASGALPTPNSAILGIDHWWLRPDKRDAGSWLEETFVASDAVWSPVSHVSALHLLIWYTRSGQFPWRSLWEGSPGIGDIDGRPVVGMLASTENSGFRSDGSRHAPFDIHNYLLRNEAFLTRCDRSTNMARTRTGHFTTFDRVDPVVFDSLAAALDRLQQLGTYVHTFLTPSANAVVEALADRGRLPDWWHEYRDVFPERLRERGIPCTVVRQPADYGLTDDFMLDGSHPSEVFVSSVLERIVAEAPESSLLSKVDRDHLAGLRSGKWSTPVVFEVPPPWRHLMNPSGSSQTSGLSAD